MVTDVAMVMMLLWWLIFLYFSEMKSPRHYYEVIAEGKLPSSLAFFPTFPNVTWESLGMRMLMLGLQYWLWAKLFSRSCPSRFCLPPLLRHWVQTVEQSTSRCPFHPWNLYPGLQRDHSFIASSLHSSTSLSHTTWYTIYCASWTISCPPESLALAFMSCWTINLLN